MPSRRSSFGGLDELAQSVSKHRRHSREPRRINQADADEITDMNAVLVAEGRQLDPDQSFKGEDAEMLRLLGLINIGVGQRLGRADLFAGKHEMHGLARLGVGAVEKDIQARGMPIDEAGALHRRAGGGQIRSSDQDIDILCVADGRFIHARNPQSDGIAAGHSIRHTGRIERGRRTKKTLTHLFHGPHRPVQREFLQRHAHKTSS